ncbi:MAG: chorismate mutase [Deltaproteobacteria bacterium CG2_30_63_29]|nr:MAG: chorismate mutase [Deltaproteobacteria bacterium CG2_30_63_29]PJB44230.1 MAG: 3-deoxy-7-phosphoheptulonate synthase [Deltaproteobacteria bacterium CG_4_9_14_3_um_filter_63_12]
MTDPLQQLRAQVEQINFDVLKLLSQRAELVKEIQTIKDEHGIPTFNPEREARMLSRLIERNEGPFSNETICHLFKEVFRASVELMSKQGAEVLMVSRAKRAEDLHFELGDVLFGADPVIIAGPCSIEDAEQMDAVGRSLSARGVGVLRGGAFKPRSSPYAFQGLGVEGLRLLKETGDRYGMVTITEVMDPRNVELVAQYSDILQIGSRNMYNYDLLREVGQTSAPVLLKRGLSATLKELLWSAEYIMMGGNERVMLCERGIRTYAEETRHTLDISAVPLLRQMTFLPVFVDVSHAAGRRDILIPLAKAAIAAGANGLMIEVHPCPAIALSDSQQQLDLEQFGLFLDALKLDDLKGGMHPRTQEDALVAQPSPELS